MSGPEDFKLGHKHNAGDPEGRRVMRDRQGHDFPPLAYHPSPLAESICAKLTHEEGHFLDDLFGEHARAAVERERRAGHADGLREAQEIMASHMKAEPVASKSVDVQAFVDALELPWFEIPLRAKDVRAFAVQAINAWQAAHPPASAPVASKSVEDCMRLADRYHALHGLKAEPERAALQAAIVAYGDAQYKAGRDAGAAECDYWAANSTVARDLAKHIRGLKR